MNLSDIFAHTAYSVSAHKTLHLLEGLGETFFSFTWHCDRRVVPPSILLGNETNLSLFHLSFDLLGTESEGHFLSFFRKGKERGQRGKKEGEQEEFIATELNPQTKKRQSIKKSDLQNEKRHKGLHCLTSGDPFITTFISFLSLSEETSQSNSVS